MKRLSFVRALRGHLPGSHAFWLGVSVALMVLILALWGRSAAG